MVGCFGRADDSQTIRLDLDNELEDAQWFPRSEIAALVCAANTHLTKEDLKKLDQTSTLGADEAARIQALAKAAKDAQATAGALAPSERKEGDMVKEQEVKGLTRVPPDTAIAGNLIRLWASGGLDLVSKL